MTLHEARGGDDRVDFDPQVPDLTQGLLGVPQERVLGVSTGNNTPSEPGQR